MDESPGGEAADCSTRALVTAVSRSKKRQSSVIYAKETNGGPVLTADVEVDSVHSIDIVTRTREIAMDAYPEEFEVVARNDQNNTFSCLDGIEFEWDLKQVIAADDTSPAGDGVSILRFRKSSEISKESTYWEDRDRRGYAVHIEGVKTGTSRVIVRIKDPAYAAVKPVEIQLIVHARIDLKPADSKYLVPFAQLSYSVTILKNTQIKPLPLPSEQYYLEVADAKIASLDPATSTVTALKEGSTTIVLRDRNLKAGIDMKLPTAEITVTKPSYLMFYIEPGTPGKEWALQDKTFYSFTIEIYDTYHNRMFASPNLVLTVVFPTAFFRIIESSSNGTYHYIQAIKQGATRIKATLEGARKPDGTIGSSYRAITLDQEVSIYPELQVSPKSVFLPWDPVVKPSYSVKLSAKGATGTYRWDSGQASVASVILSSRETANPKLITKGAGVTKVTVRDANNHVFVQQVPVEVTDVVDINIMPGIVETQLDSSVHVNLALYGRSKDAPDVNRLFDNCTEVPLSVDIVEKTRFQYVANKKAAIHPKACRALEFACIGVGHSRITISFNASAGPVSTTTIISCFMPLRIVHPDPDKKEVLALGTSVEVAFEGGPRKWPNHADRDFFADLDPVVTEIFEVRKIVDPYRYRKELHVYRVACKSLGETILRMRVGNRVSATLPNPAIIQETLSLACSMPIELAIRPKMRKDDNCPKSFQGRKYPVSCRNPIEMEVVGWDVEKRRFLNLTSLSLAWSLSDSSLAVMKSSVNFIEEVDGASGFRNGTRAYQVLVPDRKEGDLVVSLTASSYRPDVLRAEQITDYKSLVSIQTDASLLLVEKPAVDPASTTLFNHQKNQAVLRVVRGSGYFKLDISEAESKTANITFDEVNAYVTVRPKADGRITVKVIDCCVVHEVGSSMPDAEANVRIVDPFEIRVSMNSKIELGKEADVHVQVIGTSKDVIESSFHPLMNLQPVLMSDIASIKKLESADKRQSVYRIKAEKLGSTGLVFKTGSSTSHLYKKVLESRQIVLQIFSPLSVSPANLKLIVGAHFEVTVAGGLPESALEFSIPDSKTAVVSSSGLIRAATIGATTLTVKSVEKEILHSIDKITIEVVPILGVKISSPIKQLVSGSEVNLVIFGTGLKNEILDPFAFGSANPKLNVSWSVSNTDILDLSSIDSKLGIHEDGFNTFSVRVKGLREGTADVRVSVDVLEEANESLKYQVVGNRNLSDNITIRVSSKLVVNSKDSGELLLSPGSELNLRSSRDGIDKVVYTVLNGENKVFIDKGTILKSVTSELTNAVLLVKSNARGSTQLATYGVSIQPISYLMLVPQHSFDVQQDYPKGLMFVPLGAELRFDVNFYNVLGQKFDVSNLKPEIRLNRNGLLGYKWISTENHLTLELTASREGSTIVKVWIPAGVSGSNEISDFIQITAAQVIPPPPEDPVVPGVPDELTAQGASDEQQLPHLSSPVVPLVCLPLPTPEARPDSWLMDAISFLIDKCQFLVAVLLVGASLALVLHQYTRYRPVPVNPNFANAYQPSGHQPSFPHQASPNLKSNTATVYPHTPNSSFGTRPAYNSPLTQRRVATSDSTSELAQSAFGTSGLYADSQSAPRTSTSPKGVVGRPLWTSPRS